MTHLAMCRNDSCEKKDQCYRYTETVLEDEVYMEFINICKEWNSYQWFVDRENHL